VLLHGSLWAGASVFSGIVLSPLQLMSGPLSHWASLALLHFIRSPLRNIKYRLFLNTSCIRYLNKSLAHSFAWAFQGPKRAYVRAESFEERGPYLGVLDLPLVSMAFHARANHLPGASFHHFIGDHHCSSDRSSAKPSGHERASSLRYLPKQQSNAEPVSVVLIERKFFKCQDCNEDTQPWGWAAAMGP
jgi:hypothetical protein